MSAKIAPIDFMDGQFVVLHGFVRIPRRRVSKVIRGCGAPVVSLTSTKASPVRFLIGDDFTEGLARDGSHPVVVDGVLLGHVRDPADCVDLAGARIFGEDEIIASTGIGLPRDARMSMLRGALQGAPSRERWSHVVAVLEAWPDALGVEDAIRYAADLTAGWPGELCVASHRWVKRSAKTPARRMVLAGALEVRDGHDLRHVLRALDGAPRLEALTFRLVGGWFFPGEVVAQVLGHPAGRLARSITIDAPLHLGGRGRVRDALLGADLPRLETVRVRSPKAVGETLTRAEASRLRARTPPVRVLDLDGRPLWDG